MKTCRLCGVEKPLEEYYRNKRDGYLARCKPCLRAQSKADYRKNPEKYRAKLYKAKYNITLEDYDRMLSEQEGGCAICGTSDPRGHGRFHVDHNHRTGEVRGLLCTDCNTGIGSMKDSPQTLRRAIKYLEDNGYYG